MKTVILPARHPEAIKTAIELLEDGQLVAFPTDTVYGVAAAVFNPQAINKIYKVKGRQSSKAIPVLLGSQTELPLVAGQIGYIAARMAARFWPGPLTLVVAKALDLPSNLSPYPTVGVRVPDHPTALSLLKGAGPLAVTSANRSGGRNTQTAEEVYAQLKGQISLIIDGGQTPGGAPSTVVDCTQAGLIVLRAGPITLERLQGALE